MAGLLRSRHRKDASGAAADAHTVLAPGVATCWPQHVVVERSRRSPWWICVIVWAGWGLGGALLTLSAQEADASRQTPVDEALLNADLPTLGGQQFWTDEFVYHDWRIQRHVLTNHYRLLDDANVRRAWGTREACRAAFDQWRQESGLPPLSRRAVILLHGLVRSRQSMDALCQYLRARGDWTVLNVSYASSRGHVADHAAALARVVDGLESVEEVSFVGHSLGNLVIRHMLADRAAVPDGPGPRWGRIVMLAPPNRGAEMARAFRSNPLFQAVWGEPGLELAKDWSQLAARLAVPSCEFGIVAGGTGTDVGRNPWLAGDDDFVVTVAETKLPGAADFRRVACLHGTIMEDPEVHQLTCRFLQTGCFTTPDERQPILGAE
ncbi:MAG: esterase/lipase family protein [Pirellulaceae bacterium]